MSSQSSGGLQSKIKVLAEWCLCRLEKKALFQASVFGLYVAIFSLSLFPSPSFNLYLYILISPYYNDTSHNGQQLTLMASS